MMKPHHHFTPYLFLKLDKNELVKILSMIGVVYFSTTAGPWDHNRTDDDPVESRSFGF